MFTLAHRRCLVFALFLFTSGAVAETSVSRTFVNGVTAMNSRQEVHDLHIEYSQDVNSVHALGGVRGEFQGFDRPARQVNVRFPRALRPGETFSLAATTEAGSLAISRWWWTDGNGAKVSRTITVVDRRGREREAEISEYGPNQRGDEARTPELTEDVYSIINKAHHWGGAARRQGKVEIKMDIRPLLRERRLDGLDRDKVIANVRAAIKQWTHCMDARTMRQVPRAGISGQPSNHGPGRDPAVMAPGPSHQGARGQKFRSVTDRECDAAYFKYPHGLAIELITEGREGGDITAGWGVPSRYGRAMGVGPSEPDRRDGDRTATGTVHMRPQGSRSTKWHLAEDQDEDGFITNKDADTVPEDAYDFYSIFKHELGHVLCFNHTGANFDDHPHFGASRHMRRDFSSSSDDRAPYPTSVGDHEHVTYETVYFASNRPGGVGGFDIWQAIFDGSKWSVSNPGTPINSPMDDIDPHLGSDGTTLLLSSNRGGDFDLFRTIYDLREDRWRPPEPIGQVNTGSNERSPSITADMRTLFFSSDRPHGLGGVDVWVSEWIEEEGFSKPVNLGAPVNTPENEADPMVSGDGRVLLLASDRPGGEGGYDLWRSFLRETGWGEPVNLGPGINSSRDEREPGYPHHNGFLLFSSNRFGGPGRFDLYESWPVAPEEEALATLPDDPLAPIEVGPRDEVGKKSLGEKAAERVVGGVLGQILGGGSRGSSRTEGPRTRRDPTRRQDYVELEKSEPEITVGARSRWTDDGLLVSTRISDHDEKGTYHSVYLQSCDGRRLYPRRLEIYDLWAEHSLTVSWTRTTYVDGQVVNRESGGWSDAWSEVLGRHTVDDAELPGIWQMYGYDRAHSGIQQLGAYFNLNPEQLAELGDLALITHITRPEQDPVVTEPFNWLLSSEVEQPRLYDPSASIHQVTDAPSHWQQWQEDCDKAIKPGTELTQTVSAGTVVEEAAEEWDLGALEAGKTYPTTVSVSNMCEGIRKFRVESESPWLRLEKSDYVVGPGEEVAADAIVDSIGLGECEYAAEVKTQCLDCPPSCHQKKERITARAKIKGKYRDPCAERYEKCLSNIMRWGELAEAQCRVENEMESLLKDNPDCMERMNAACSEVRRQYSELEEKSERLGSEMEESDAKWKECKATGASWSAEAEYGEETVERSGEGLDCHPRGMVSVSYLVSTHLLVPLLSHPPPPYTFEDIGTVPPGGKVRIIGPPVNGFYPVDLTCPEDKSGYNLETDAKVGWISKVHTTIYKDGDDEFTGVGPRSGGQAECALVKG